MEKMQCTKKRGDFAKGAKALAFAMLLLCGILWGVMLQTDMVLAAEANGKNIYLQPGDTYDAGSAGNNTTVYIDKAGEYTLKGNSDNLRFIIKTGGVKVYLADGLHIDPGAYADAGKSASAISVQHTSGTVRLVSKESARIYFGSHYMAPAIHKDGTKGKLVFETQNPGKPGTITAKSADWSESAAIGSGKKKGSTGNIVFNSGNIYATADDYAAGIGGGNGSKGRSITINGGYINAQGGQYAAGIGSGMYKEASDITINGGEVVAKGGKGGAGIGSGLENEVAPIKGEHIKITGGKVTATGGFGAAGIGGGRNADGEHIEIIGGEIIAKGGGAGGAGIGGGGNFDPGGYGGDSFIGGDGRYITISGGTVTATGGEDGAGIGGGSEEGNGENITISGGTVVASGGGDGAGIGGALKGRAKDITITGGKVTATGAGGGAGIGGGSVAWGRNLKISGGIVRATGGKHADGIGGGTKHQWWEFWKKDFTNSVFISGGTVVAKKGSKGSADIGGRGSSTVSITGGSVLAVNNSVRKQAKNQAGDTVHKTTVSFYNSTGEDYAKHKIDSLNFTDKTPAYGTNDLYNVNSSYSAVWPWLPKKSGAGVKSGALTEDDGTTMVTKKYTAMEIKDQTTSPWTMKQTTIAPGTTGTMYPPNNIILDNGRNSEGLNGIKPEELPGINSSELAGLKDGSATGEFLEKKLGNFVPVSGSITGMHIEGYSISDNYEEYIIADAEGNLIANEDCPQYVNDKGQWIAAASQVRLYAVWKINTYNIHFDSNKPEGAAYEVEGNMTDQTELSSQVPEILKANDYTLRGWKFTGWNTEPDGSGKSFADQDRIQKQVGHDETVTLYAQWERVKYTVTFEPGEGGPGIMAPQTLEYDIPAKLNDNTFTPPAGKTFLGWSTGALGHLYEDGASVVNLCPENMEVDPVTGTGEGYTLTAQWGDKNHDVVMVTLDGQATSIAGVGLEGEWNQLLLQRDGDSTRFKMQYNEQAPGIYWIENLPTDNDTPEQAIVQNQPNSGRYQILLGKDGTAEPLETGKYLDISGSKLNVQTLDYCTVGIEMETGRKDDGSAWLGDDKANLEDVILKGDQIKINCNVTATGQHFVQYTALYNIPTWETDETEPNQTITVTGRARITAHIEPNRYKVTFDANASDATGSMADQDFVYGHPQELFTCGFAREGYTFAGWTVTPRWPDMESLYKDGETIGTTPDIKDNLTSIHGATVTLYAHWIAMPYTIHYDSNGAASGGWALDQRSYHDNPTALPNAKKLGFSMKNYHFTGWNTKSGGDGISYPAGKKVSNLADGEESITLYAQWAHDSYTVHYDANGGTGSMLDEEFWIDAYEPLHAASFKRDGYTFAGWNTKRDGTGAAYDDREEVMNLAKTGGSVTLYAQWKQGGSDGSSQTGDAGRPWIPVLLMIASLGSGAAILRRRKI